MDKISIFLTGMAILSFLFHLRKEKGNGYCFYNAVADTTVWLLVYFMVGSLMIGLSKQDNLHPDLWLIVLGALFIVIFPIPIIAIKTKRLSQKPIPEILSWYTCFILASFLALLLT